MAQASKVKFIRLSEAAISSYPIGDGQILVSKDTGNIYFDIGSSRIPAGNTRVSTLMLQRPTSDDKLYPVVEVSASRDFSNTMIIAADDAADQGYFSVFTGSEWTTCPSDGFGTPFEGMPVAVDMSVFEDLPQPYFVRYAWKNSVAELSNYKATVFPSIMMPAPIEATTDSSGGSLPDSIQISDVEGLQESLDGINDALSEHIDEALQQYAKVSHEHTIAEVTALQSELDAKAPLHHTHATTDVDGLNAFVSSTTQALNDKAPLQHTHEISDVTGLEAALNAKASTTVTEDLEEQATDLDSRVTALESQEQPKVAWFELHRPAVDLVVWPAFKIGNTIWNLASYADRMVFEGLGVMRYRTPEMQTMIVYTADDQLVQGGFGPALAGARFYVNIDSLYSLTYNTTMPGIGCTFQYGWATDTDNANIEWYDQIFPSSAAVPAAGVTNPVSGNVNGMRIVLCTQEEYDSMPAHESHTLYIVT